MTNNPLIPSSSFVGQCHVKIAKESDKSSTGLSVRMGDNSKMNVLRCGNVTVEDEVGSTMNLKNTKIVKGMATNIISLL